MARMFTPPRAPGPSSNKKQDAPGEQKKQDGHEKPQKSPKAGRKAQDDKCETLGRRNASPELPRRQEHGDSA
ncbi:hypothetical protein [Dysosmobacter welbionis]